MSTKHLVADDLLVALDSFPNFAVNAETLPKIRAARDAEPLPEVDLPDIEVSEVVAPGQVGTRMYAYSFIRRAR